MREFFSIVLLKQWKPNCHPFREALFAERPCLQRSPVCREAMFAYEVYVHCCYVTNGVNCNYPNQGFLNNLRESFIISYYYTFSFRKKSLILKKSWEKFRVIRLLTSKGRPDSFEVDLAPFYFITFLIFVGFWWNFEDLHIISCKLDLYRK